MDAASQKEAWVVTHPALKYLSNTMASDLLGNVKLSGFCRSHGVRRASACHITVRTGHTGRALERSCVFDHYATIGKGHRGDGTVATTYFNIGRCAAATVR